MKELEFGQFLWLYARFDNDGTTSKTVHPYMILSIDHELNCVEAVQFDSLEGREFRAASEKCKIIYNNDPDETVIQKDSFALLDHTFQFELCDLLYRFRRSEDKLSFEKRTALQTAYVSYRRQHHVPEQFQVYMDKDELLELNPIE